MTFPFMISSKTKSWLVNWIERTPELSYQNAKYPGHDRPLSGHDSAMPSWVSAVGIDTL